MHYIKPDVIKINDHRVFLIIEAPNSKTSNLPLVLMCHGFTGNHIEVGRIFTDCSRELVKHGICTVRFDYYGHGNSDGLFEDFSISKAIEDALGVYEYIVENVKPLRIGLLGLSLGGLIALSIGAIKGVSTIVLWSSVGPSWLKGLVSELLKKGNEYVNLYGSWRIKRRNLEEIMKVNMEEFLPKVRVPTLLIYAADDNVTPLNNATEIYCKLTCKKELFIIEKGGHGFNDPVSKKRVIEKTIDWFIKHLVKVQ